MTKYALCVGNNYPNTSNELSGCRNDANDWADMLEEAGYTADVLLEGPAALTLAMLRGYIGRMGWGDRLVFTYSGHGTWVPDQDGDESDMRDEALYMADGALIIDDDLQGVFAELPTGSGALILSDSCHSGTVSRFTKPFFGEGQARFISPDRLGLLTTQQAIAIESRTTPSPSRHSASLISGCGDLEYSYDAWFGDRANGAFSRAAIDAYKPGASLSAWFKAIRLALPSSSYPQSPQATYASLYRRYAKAL